LPGKSNRMAISRAQLGARQREASRAAIVAAAMRVFERKMPDAAVIDDFITEAGVARGTFYNHFKDVDAVQLAVATKLSTEFNESIRRACNGIADPAERIAIAVRHYLRGAAEYPHWGWVIVRIGFHGPLGPLMRDSIRPEIEAGLEQGRFVAMSAQNGVDLVMGTGLTAMQTLLEGRAEDRYATDVVATILRGLGLTVEDAAQVAVRPLPPFHKSVG
jgi:AcrR family transcriptional regulator